MELGTEGGRSRRVEWARGGQRPEEARGDQRRPEEVRGGQRRPEV